MTYEIVIDSCRECPFSTPFSDACKHPDSPRTPRHGTQVKLSDLNFTPAPATCPLHTIGIRIELRRDDPS